MLAFKEMNCVKIKCFLMHILIGIKREKWDDIIVLTNQNLNLFMFLLCLHYRLLNANGTMDSTKNIHLYFPSDLHKFHVHIV